MPSYRAAGQVSPYLIQTHAVNHHDQLPAAADNAGRVRQARQRENKSRPREERSPRIDDDLRFNMGAPRWLRPGYRGRRSGRQDRAYDEQISHEGTYFERTLTNTKAKPSFQQFLMTRLRPTPPQNQCILAPRPLCLLTERLRRNYHLRHLPHNLPFVLKSADHLTYPSINYVGIVT